MLGILLKFQFHKGTIRTSGALFLCVGLSHFNSIKVRLEHPAWKRVFHQRVFQFHKGTIRTPWLSVSPSPLPNFNSIKVRLERKKSHYITALPPNFNSIKVRLERPIARRRGVGRGFQFHKGTIRTYQEFVSYVNDEISIP